MTTYEKSLAVLTELFGRDCQFALATVKDNVPSVRVVDTFYEDGAFYIVTYNTSQKAMEISANERVALCDNLYRFSGTAHIIGHPLQEENNRIRSKLIAAFEPWYFKHNDESDANMCYIKFEPEHGFFYQDGTGYNVDFQNRTAQAFPFVFDMVVV